MKDDCKALFLAYTIKYLLNKGHSESLSYYLGARAVSEYLLNGSVTITIRLLSIECDKLSSVFMVDDNYEVALTDLTIGLSGLYYRAYGINEEDWLDDV